MEEISKHQPPGSAHRETVPEPGLEARFLCMKNTYLKLELLTYNSSPITKAQEAQDNQGL